MVLRARGFRLYTEGSRSFPRRLIDLWLNGGAAVLGHTPPNVLREIKNTASRGLYAPFAHFTEARYLKALSKLFPGRSFRLYAAPPPELASLLDTGEVKLWRPFARETFVAVQRLQDARETFVAMQRLQDTKPENPFAVNENENIFIPVLPGIQTWRGNLPFGLCVIAAGSEDLLTQFPSGDSLSPILLSAAARGVHDILAAPDRGKPALPRTFRVLHSAT